MQFAMWAYPWDLLDPGVESVIDQLVGMGIDEINLATNYHSVQAFLPHNPQRRTFFARSSSYFQPGDMYGQLEPVPNEEMGEEDWVAQIHDEVADSELSLNSWTIGCHNSRLGMKHRDRTIESPYGDSLVFGLCPSDPEVQEYLVSLLSDLDERCDFDRIELETFDYFYGTGFGWHHDKFHVELGDLGEFLFGLCFCEECRENAVAAGIDTETARADCIEALNAIIEGTLPATVDVAGWMANHPEVYEYALRRTDTLSGVIEDANTVVSGSELGHYIGNIGVEDTWKQGIDLELLSDSLDFFTALAYEPDVKSTLDCVTTATELTSIPVHAGILPGHPHITAESTLVEIVTRLSELGIERVSFYNYGLLPKRNLNWIESAVAAVR